MSTVKIIGIVLIVAGALGLAYGSFSFTKDTHTAKLGPIQLSVKEKETVNVPAWAGIAGHRRRWLDAAGRLAQGLTAHCRYRGGVSQKNKACAASSRRCAACSHVFDHHLPEARARHLRRAFHQAREVVGDLLAADRLFHRADDQVGGLLPAHVAQHHLGREDFGARIDVVLARVLGRGAVRRLEARHVV